LIKVLSAEFVKSAQGFDDSLPEDLSEVVIIGRSNVGKSTLLNLLLQRKNLAKSSSTPGKTRLINFFETTMERDGEKRVYRVVDLPGYGYAKVSKSEKEAWGKKLTAFLKNRSNIHLFILLRDARHPEIESDDETLEFVESIKKPYQNILTVYTKMDKLTQSELQKLKNKNRGALLLSSLKNYGIEQLRESIDNALFGVKSC